jgi:ankyrin repeat protein
MRHIETMQRLNCPELSTTAHELVKQCICSTTLQRLSSVNLHDQIREKAKDGCYDLQQPRNRFLDRYLNNFMNRLPDIGADTKAVTSDGWTLLHIAARNGHLGVTNRLLEAGADAKAVARNGVTALHVAARNGHLEVTNRLLKAGADAKTVTSDEWTALHVAAQNGHPGVVNLLLGLGASAFLVLKSAFLVLESWKHLFALALLVAWLCLCLFL